MSFPDPEIGSLARKHSLLNAYRHDGHAELGAVLSKLVGERPELRHRIKELIPHLRSIVNEVNQMSQTAQRAALQSSFPEALEGPQPVEPKRLPPLPNAVEGAFTVRLPPEPSGHMHIGHAMAAVINHDYARQYRGAVWLRFEDTNPRGVKLEYYESFRDGYRWLGVAWDHEKNVSDDLPQIYAYGRQLLEEGHAYACTCRLETARRNRAQGIACDCRGRDVADSLALWDGMHSRTIEEGAAVVRLRGDMSSEDYSLRDPTLFRIIEHAHPLQGNRYRVWPVYDFAVVVEDQLCSVTHILRSLEFHAALQDRMRQLLRFRPVTTVQFSRFAFAGTPVQKRLLRPLVQQRLVEGWHDPRMPTVRGLSRRGILPQAIRRFTRDVGYTRSQHEFDWDLILAVNRKLLDASAKRLHFVADPWLLRVSGAPKRVVELRNHPTADLGSRRIATHGEFLIGGKDAAQLKRGMLIRLIELYNIMVLAVDKGRVDARYESDELRPDIPKIQWVVPPGTPLRLLVPGPLYVGDQFNPDSLRIEDGRGETAVTSLEPNEIVQLVRVGFCRIDAPGVGVLAHR